MIYDNVLSLIGNTPIVKYNDRICLKLEYYNPSNSIKDRAAYSMIKSAMDRGDITQNTLIIEPTSGNTGIGLAMCCAVLGLRLIICMPESMSLERRKSISAYGAELVLTPAQKGMQGAVDMANELAKENPDSYIPMQFSNPDNPKAHKQTADEIRDAIGHENIVVAAGIGTGGTACGLKQYLKGAIVYGVEPLESPLLTKGVAGAHKIQGIGANFIPAIYSQNNKTSPLDGVIAISGEDAINSAKELAQKHGIFCGISAGANLAAAKQLALKYPDKTILAIVPDSGERYLSVW